MDRLIPSVFCCVVLFLTACGRECFFPAATDLLTVPKGILYGKKINIATMQLYRGKRGGDAVMVMVLDQPITEDEVKWIEEQEGITKVTYIDMGGEEHV